MQPDDNVEALRHYQKGSVPNGDDLVICPPIPDLRDFLAQEYPEESTLIGPIQSQSVVHCGAGPGVGKTHFAVAITLQLTTGQQYWHWEVPEPRSVLFVDGEMPARRLQERFKGYHIPAVRKDLKIFNAVNWAASQGLPHPNLAELEWQEVFMAQGAGLDVWVFDNVMSLVSVPGESMSSDGFWKPVHDFNLRARAAGKTVIWLDHVNAEGRAFGTRTKTWAADMVFTLKKPEEHQTSDGCVFTLAFTKTRGLHGRDADPFELSMVTDLEGKTAWRYRYEDEVILDEVRSMLDSGMSQRQIAAELKCSVGKANKLCARVRNAEEV